MRSRASRIVITLALLICFVCPLVEMFDNWDHTLQTGNDTEYGLVVLALCVGVTYSLGRFVLKPALLAFGRKRALASPTQRVSQLPRRLTLLFVDETSPPPLPLRI